MSDMKPFRAFKLDEQFFILANEKDAELIIAMIRRYELQATWQTVWAKDKRQATTKGKRWIG